MFTESQFFTLSDKTELHIKMHKADHPVWLIATHGLAEHLGRHQYLIDLFAQDFNILLYDLRGHGKSIGRRVYVDRFTYYFQDLEEIILMLKNQHAMKQFVLFGHSVGGTITCGYLQNQKDPVLYPKKIFLSSPAVNVSGKMGLLIKYLSSNIFAKLSSLPFSIELKGVIDLKKLSHDNSVFEDYINDQLNCLHLHTKLMMELSWAMKTVFSRPLQLKSPCFCAYGTKDEILDPVAIRDYFNMVEPSVKVQSFPGAYHEIHNESEEYRSDYFSYLKNSLTVSV